jgi:hypothetical protein
MSGLVSSIAAAGHDSSAAKIASGIALMKSSLEARRQV